MGIFGAIVCLGFFFMVVFDFCQHLPEGQRRKFRRWFLIWAAKGLLVPVVVWILFDGEIFNWLPTFSPSVAFATTSGHHFAALCDLLAFGLILVGSYWAAVTSVWLLTALALQTEHPEEFKRCCLIWSALLAPGALLMVLWFGWRFAGLAVTLWFLPVIQRVLTLQPGQQKLKPIYSHAIAKLHFDKHEEAEKAVLEELEKCEDDFDGWLLLAELYANHFKDLAGAEDVIRQTCDHPNTTPSQVAVAFHRLADWHLKLANDPVAARRDLWEICRRHPKSHLDRMARLRIDHIPASKEEYVQQLTPKAFSLPNRAAEPEETTATAPAGMTRLEALARAKHCVERLKKSPDDMALREDLARIFVEQLDAVDAGMEQLELLLALPNPPEKKAAQWLLLMAEWKVKYKKDQASARQLLERIITVYPNTTPAFAAQAQLNLLHAEKRMQAIRAKLNLPQP